MTAPFLVVGAMKSGTTTLHAMLSAHPDVTLVGEKESAAFLDPAAASVAARRMRAATTAAAGEVATAYMQQPVHEPPVERVRAELGTDVRIVAILRDPFERAVSHWRHWYQLGREHAGPDAIADPAGAYAAFSSYHRQLAPWIEAFGADHLLALRLESYEHDPAGTSAQLWDFLGLARPSTTAAVHENAGGDRLVALGWRARVRESSAYRATLRRALPVGVRRAVLRGAGGAARRIEPPPLPASLRADFTALVADDARRLQSVYPHLSWAAAPLGEQP